MPGTRVRVPLPLMLKPSDEFRASRIWQEDANLRAIYQRYYHSLLDRRWEIDRDQLSLDLGYLCGVILRLSEDHEPQGKTRV